MSIPSSSSSALLLPSESGPPPLWRQRNFLLLWGGQGVSILGTMLSAVARPFLVFQLGGGAREVGIVLALTSLPFVIVSLPAGAWIDRWDRKRTMMICDLGRGLTLTCLVGGLLSGHASLALIYATTLLESLCSVFFSLAETASLPQVVDKRQLASALNANQALFSLAFLLGPPVGGLLVSVHILLPFALDAVSFVVSVVTLFLITTPFQGNRSAQSESVRRLLHEIGEGLRWLWHEPKNRFLTLLNGLTALALGASVLVIIRLVTRVIPVGAEQMLPTYTGVLLTCGGIGGLLGTAMCAYLLKRLTLPLLICSTLWLQGAVFFLLILAPGYVALAVLFVVSYALWPTFNAALASYRLARIPDELQGRINAIYQLVGYTASPLGAILMSILLAQEGIIVTAAARSVLLVLAAAVTMFAFVRWRITPE